MKRLKLTKGIMSSVSIFLATMITKGIAYITTPIFTRILTPEEYGIASIYITWTTILGAVFMFTLHDGVFNNGMLDFSEDRDSFSFSLLTLSNVITIVSACVLYVAFPYIKGFIGLESKYLVLMIIIFIFEPAYLFWLVRQRYEYKYKCSFIITVLRALLMPAVAIIFVLSDKIDNVTGKIYGTDIVSLCFYIAFYILLVVKSKYKVKMKYWKYAFFFNLPLIPHYLSGYILNTSDKIMIKNIAGDSQTAYYSVAHSIAAIVLIIWNSINPSLIPYTYEKCEERKYDEVAKITHPLLTLFFAACVGVIFLAPEVISVMGGEAYREAVYVIPPIVAGVFFQASYFIYSNVIFYYKKTKYILCASMTAMIINIVLNYIFIGQFGYLAAGYTTFISYLIQTTIVYLAMRKAVGKSIYNMKYIGFLSLSMVVIALISNFLYAFNAIRYLIIAVLIVVLFLNRNRIINIIRSVRNKEKNDENSKYNA